MTDVMSINTDVVEEDQPDAALPLIAHLVELRKRLLRCVLAILLVFSGLFYFANDIYAYISAPLRALLPDGASMVATDVASPFLTPFKLSMVLAVFIAMPFILSQVWSFISPGLYQREKRIAVPLLMSSILLFYAGLAFVYYLVFPIIFAFFAGTTPDGVALMTDISQYLNFVLKLFFAFGCAFEIPVATVLLLWTGIVSRQSLVSKRPHIIVGCFAVAMLMTPPDVISQAMLAFPMWMLFELGLLLGFFVDKEKRQTKQLNTES